MSETDKLVISFKFPPDSDASGIIVAKRIMVDNSKVDVLHNYNKDESLNFAKLDELINERLEVKIDSKRDTIESIFSFIKQGLELIDEREYKEVYSRSWYMSNHFLALEYKFNHPDVIWTAEFSDPVLRNMKGKVKNYKSAVLDNQEYIDRLNSNLKRLNRKPLENPNNSYYIAEYLTFLFADRIIFTNPNQIDMMLETYDEDIRKLVIDKSQIMPHPTLDEEYYHLKESDIELNDDDINIAYFGNSYYPLRHFEPVFYAYESLNHKYKDKIKFHIFINTEDILKILIDQLDFKDNIIIRKPIEYLEFLNATTKFDILLINDTLTENRFSINPYLPSKLSDYKGSGRDIWAIYEDKSILSGFDAKYKSSMTDFNQSRDVLVEILKDYGYDDENYGFADNYYQKRISQLNLAFYNEFNAKDKLKEKNKKLKAKNKRLKKDYDKILSSNSWKMTEPLRRLRNK